MRNVIAHMTMVVHICYGDAHLIYGVAQFNFRALLTILIVLVMVEIAQLVCVALMEHRIIKKTRLGNP